MYVAIPAQRSEPQAPAQAAGWISTTTLGLTALCTLLITVALGLRMMARWILRGRAGPPAASRFRRPPAPNFAHLGLASASLLIWIAYLATGMTGLAWTATALLTLVMGLGMTLVFLPRPAREDSARGQTPPVFTTGAHIIFATATFLFALLTAIGAG